MTKDRLAEVQSDVTVVRLHLSRFTQEKHAAQSVCVSHHDGALPAVVVVELQHVSEGKITDDV